MKPKAEDHFERYYAEKLWETIPSIYRHEDGIAERPGVLRAIVETIAEQAAVLRRSQDRLWEDQFIEWCDDWAVPYIGDLVGTRLISALNTRGRRVDVAKTIYYRRRKGTLRILEELISDITGWEGKIVENFQRLGRARHGLDPQPSSLAGRFSGTLPGGWADLRRPYSSEVSGGPFDEFYHTPDVRRHRGRTGRYNIPKLAIHLYRLTAFRAADVTPFPLEDGRRFTFDPSGRDIPLFARRNRPDDWEEWRSALEWELPVPIRCRLLAHAEYLVSEAVVQALEADPGLTAIQAAALRRISGWTFRTEARLRLTLQSTNEPSLLDPAILTPLLRYAILENCGKQALLPNALAVNQNGTTDPDHGSMTVKATASGGIVTAEHIVAANLENWSTDPAFTARIFDSAAEKRLAVDPANGRFLLAQPIEEQPVAGYYYGFFGPIGAGPYDRRAVEDSEPDRPSWENGDDKGSSDLHKLGVTQIEDSKTYRVDITKLSVENIILQAANGRRPYLRLSNNFLLNTGTVKNARLTLDGLWIGAGDAPQNIILRGHYECVVIRNCTVDPGDVHPNAAGGPLHPVVLLIEGFVENLEIQSSILGPIRTEQGGIVESVCIRDSIVQAIEPDAAAVSLNSGLLDVKRCTVFGRLQAHRLEASELIVTGRVTVADTQTGCFRFGAAPSDSRLPRPYESFLFDKDSQHWFSSRRFGHPGYGQLSDAAPEPLRRGAENGSEMGAFSSLLQPVKMDGLRTKIEEYMPFGLIPIFINET